MLARWLSEVFESLLSVESLLARAVKTLVWLLVLVFPYHNKDSTTFCMGVWNVLQLFGLELNYLGLGSKLYLFGFWAQHFKNQAPLPTQH